MGLTRWICRRTEVDTDTITVGVRVVTSLHGKASIIGVGEEEIIPGFNIVGIRVLRVKGRYSSVTGMRYELQNSQGGLGHLPVGSPGAIGVLLFCQPGDAVGNGFLNRRPWHYSLKAKVNIRGIIGGGDFNRVCIMPSVLIVIVLVNIVQASIRGMSPDTVVTGRHYQGVVAASIGIGAIHPLSGIKV